LGCRSRGDDVLDAPDGKVVSVPPDVLVQTLPDNELVFLNLATERYFGLDRTGAAMWVALTETGQVDRAFERLLKQFDIEPEVLKRDLDAFISRLTASGLLHVGEDPKGTISAAPSD
jgi:hypothetical protein